MEVSLPNICSIGMLIAYAGLKISVSDAGDKMSGFFKPGSNPVSGKLDLDIVNVVRL